MPDTRHSLTRKNAIAGHEFYITVGFYPIESKRPHQPGEVFITISKQGSVLSGMADSLATTISLALQFGVPWEHLSEKYHNTRFEPSGRSLDGTQEYTSLAHAIAHTVDQLINYSRSIWNDADIEHVKDIPSEATLPPVNQKLLDSVDPPTYARPSIASETGKKFPYNDWITVTPSGNIPSAFPTCIIPIRIFRVYRENGNSVHFEVIFLDDHYRNEIGILLSKNLPNVETVVKTAVRAYLDKKYKTIKPLKEEPDASTEAT